MEETINIDFIFQILVFAYQMLTYFFGLLIYYLFITNGTVIVNVLLQKSEVPTYRVNCF